MRRKFLIAAAVAVCTVQYGMQAHADSLVVTDAVSVQFPQFYGTGPGTWAPNNLLNELIWGGAVNMNFTAGVYATNNWNVANTNPALAASAANGWTGVVTSANLLDGNGQAIAAPQLMNSAGAPAATGLDFSLSFTSGDHTNAGGWPQVNWYPPAGVNGDGFLATGTAFTTQYTTDPHTSVPTTLTISGLDPTAHYSVIAYVDTPWWGGGSGSITDGSSTVYVKPSDGQGSWVPMTSSNSASPDVGNYVEFDNLHGLSSITLTESGNYLGLGGFQLLTLGATPIAKWTWAAASIADVTDVSNWTLSNGATGAPNAAGAVVKFGSSIGTHNRTVVADDNVTYGQLTFDNAQTGNTQPTTGYNLAGHGTLTIDNTGAAGNGAITVNSGKHFISMTGGVVFAGTTSTTNITIANGASLTIQSPVSVAAGASIALTVGAGSTMNFSSAGALLQLQSLALDPTGHLGLGTSDLLVKGDGSNIGTQILAMTCTASPSKGLGYLTGSEYIALHGTTFDGATVDPTDAVVAYTWLGDADLDGFVSASDYMALDTGYLFGLTGWSHGQFLPGAVGAADFAAIDLAYSLSDKAAAASEMQIHSQWFGAAYTDALSALAAPVPEPASLALLAFAGAGLLARRNKR